MEPHFHAIGRLIVLAGVFLVIVGVIMMFFDRVPFIGKLPGDFVVRRKNFTLYFPLMTGVILSVILTIVLNIVSRR